MAITRSPQHRIFGLFGCGGFGRAKPTQGVRLVTLRSVPPLVVGLLLAVGACGGSAGIGVPASGIGSPITASSPEKTSAAAPVTTSAAATPDGVYMVDRTIYTGSPWTVVLPSVTVAGGRTIVTVSYQNVSSSSQQLVCPEPIQRTSLTISGSVYTESDSYCARNPGRVWTVPAGSNFPSWAKYDVAPDLAQPFTLNNWWGWGEVPDIQLIPFGCIVGPGGSCLGVPNSVPSQWMPTPPEWLTSAATGACVLDFLTWGAAKAGITWPQGLYTIWADGLGGAIRVQDPPGTVNITKVWIVLTSAIPFGSCADLGVVLLGQALPTATQSELQQILNYPVLTITTP